MNKSIVMIWFYDLGTRSALARVQALLPTVDDSFIEKGLH